MATKSETRKAQIYAKLNTICCLCCQLFTINKK
nr:MAG TPA: hypothetical protein [Caudoviricetes sp.]